MSEYSQHFTINKQKLKKSLEFICLFIKSDMFVPYLSTFKQIFNRLFNFISKGYKIVNDKDFVLNWPKLT